MGAAFADYFIITECSNKAFIRLLEIRSLIT